MNAIKSYESNKYKVMLTKYFIKLLIINFNVCVYVHKMCSKNDIMS